MLVDRLNFFLNDYQVRVLTDADQEQIFNLQKQHPNYHATFQKATLTAEMVLADLTTLPPGCQMQQKFYLGIFKEEKLVAILDLVLGYPENQAVWLGLLMLDESELNHGLGTKIIQKVCQTLKREGYQSLGTAVAVDQVAALNFFMQQEFVLVAEQTIENHDQKPVSIVILVKEL
ncbi:GNAT family N-acetyltransferase [Ligilactobacillus ceti]|uniref:N-acetyltransferase domain-containing protein n=1 Tax=Ligilactobacillus ceti DSM 22408 TaxID=1122146 RepID=A0A0R2KKA9_9LACO|nr:GNAT family N-acetyltransferase [Ligilactobacillus ceti]KRN89810.1 hypothetical protein IV53_GL001137 [Ligilactobacillus ceti DSM 22408]